MYRFAFLIRILLMTLVFLFAMESGSQAQQVRYLKDQTHQVVIPFEFYNNFIVISIRVNGLPLKFIVDTGAEYTILFHQEIADWLGLESQRRVRLMGADLSAEIYARVVPNVSLLLQDQCHVSTPLLVLEDDFFEMEQVIGLPVAGILGGSVLRNFKLKVDYVRPELTLYDPAHFKVPSGYEQIQVEVEKSKPYISSGVSLHSGEVQQVKLLLDTGASLASLLYARPENGIVIPDTVITGTLGVGLGGSLRGYMGKMEFIEIGPYSFSQYLTSFQKPEIGDSLLLSFGKDGIIGNGLLSRFTFILDYQESRLYLKPNRWFKRKMQYDRSGLMLITVGKDLRTVQVLDVIIGSPAHEAGIKPGDNLVRINGLPVMLVGFDRILRKLSGKSGKKIRLSVKRGQSRPFLVPMVLRDLL
jgi:hypothetical protein